MTDNDCYAALHFQIATKDGSDTPDGLDDEEVKRRSQIPAESVFDDDKD